MDFELTNEQKDIAKAARKFAEGEFTDRAEGCDREESFDEAIFKKAAELGFVGIFIDEKYGGAGLGTLEQCILQEEFSAVDLGMGAAILSACFGAEIIEAFRMEEQKSKYLPPLPRGEAVMGSTFTEPDAGSDLAAAAKAFCGQIVVRCADRALQMHGGYGYLVEYKVQRLYRDAKIIEIYEATTEIEKMIIAKNLFA